MNQNLRNAPEFSWARLVAQSKDAVIASIVAYYDSCKYKKDDLLNIFDQFACWLIQETDQTYTRLLNSNSTDPTFKEFYKCWNDYRSTKKIGENWHIPKLKAKQHRLSPRKAARALGHALETCSLDKSTSACSNPDYREISLIWAAYSVCMKLAFLHKEPSFVNMGQDDQGIKSSHFDNPTHFKHSNYVKRFIHDWLSSPAVAKKIVEYLNLYEINKISSNHAVTQKYVDLRNELEKSAPAINGTDEYPAIWQFDSNLPTAKRYIMDYQKFESTEKKLIFNLHKQACHMYRQIALEQKYIDFRNSLNSSGSDLYEFDSDLPTAKKLIMNCKKFESEEKKLIFKLHVRLNGFMNNVITFGEVKLNTFWKKEFKLPLSILMFNNTIRNISSLSNKLSEATAKLKEAKEATAKFKEASGNNSDAIISSMNTAQFEFDDCKNNMTKEINKIFEDTALDVNKHFVCTGDPFDDVDIILIAITAAV